MIRRIPVHLMIGVCLFVVVAAAIVWLMSGTVNSPDEAANMLFARSWRDSAQLRVAVPGGEQPAAYPLFPRSTMPAQGSVVPAGFVGLPVLFGSISVVLGDWSLMHLTIFFTAIAAIAWWYVVRQVGGRPVADVSFWLFIAHPAVFYYTARGLFPNMLVVDAIIIALAAAWFVYNTRGGAGTVWSRRLMSLLAVLSVVIALAVRPYDALVVLALLAVTCAIAGSGRVRAVAIAGLLGIMALAGGLWAARAAGWFAGAYRFIAFDSVSSALFPFGIMMGRAIKAALKYGGWLFAPWSLLAVAGFGVWLWAAYKERQWSRAMIAYAGCMAVLCAWLFIAYGSWSIADNPANPHAVTLGSSYVRYWLWWYIAGTPWIAWLVLYSAVRRGWVVRPVVVGFIALAVIAGGVRAYRGVDGLGMVIRDVNHARKTVAAMADLVPQDAIIAVQTWDKYVFPQYAVLQPFPRDVRTLAAARELLARNRPLYALLEPITETDTLWLRHNGFVATPVAQFGRQMLYRISVWNADAR